MSQDQQIDVKAEFDRLARENAQLKRRITAVEDRIEEIRNQNDGPDGLEKVVAHAERKANGDDTVVLDYNEVMAAADVSHQTAYNYMDKLVQNNEFAQNHQTPDGLKRIKINTALSNGFRKE